MDDTTGYSEGEDTVDDQITDAAAGAESATPAADLDEALAALETVSERPLVEHPDVYQEIHTSLQSALTDIDGA